MIFLLMVRWTRFYNILEDFRSESSGLLTVEAQDRLELAALDGPERRGSAAHPQAFKLP